MASVAGLNVRFVFTALAAAIASSTASAQTAPPAKPHVEASLIAETRAIVPGEPLHLALRQKIQAGWHTYWLNPGDSGLPTELDLSLPPGFKAAPLQWPIPERFTSGSVVDYGYTGEILIPVTIETPAALVTGTDIKLTAHASWLACSDICIPEDAALAISIPVAAATELDPRWTDAFESGRARIPTPNPFPTRLSVAKDTLTLHVAMGDASKLRDIMFFPVDIDVVDNVAPQIVTGNSSGLDVTLARDASKAAPAGLNGVLVFRDLAAKDDGPPVAIAVSASAEPAVSGAPVGIELVVAIVLAFAGGIILNLMPCVLPILAIKAFSLVQHGQTAPREVRRQGLAYAAGVLISFAVIASVLIGLRAAGAEIGWGFQLQSPLFVAAMIYILFTVGLNLSGVFTFGAHMTGVGSELTALNGYAGSFFSGALATLVATPCTAPFMAAALGFAITQPWYSSLAVFEAVGLGLALPYLMITFSPAARRFLPKPGIWMLRLKECLAFPVYGTAIWLLYVLSLESGALAAAAALVGILLIAFAAWLYEIASSSQNRRTRWSKGIAAMSVGAALTLLLGTSGEGAINEADDAGLSWQSFSAKKLDALRAEGRPIFVDVTAAWCITCKVNERAALADPAVRKEFSDEGVAAIKADWTREDRSITQMLEANGRAGVPLYLFYPKARTAGERRPPIVLPQILTTSTVLNTIRAE
jgi:thiol:disulfide interchange protein DsbD